MAIDIKTLIQQQLPTGPTGPTGTSGVSGTSGFSGFSSFSGISGFSGASGTSGFSGVSGASGTSGFSGTSGTSGFSGASGTSGFSGVSGASGTSGFSGRSGFSGISGFSGSQPWGTSGTSISYTTGNVGIGITSPATRLDVSGTIQDDKGDLRTLVINVRSTGYVLIASDHGKLIDITTGGVTVPANVFSVGQNVSIFNDSGVSQTITTTGLTVYLAGTATTGNRTLAQRGICTLICVAANTFVISGAGLT